MARRLALAVALVAALLPVAGAGGADAQTPKRGGTLVMGTLREPPCFNAFLARCHLNAPPAGLIMSLALRGAFDVGPGFAWRYDLVSRVDTTTRAPITLVYRIRPEARWSDGRPVTPEDFVFTHETLKRLPLAERDGLGLEFVRSVRQLSPTTVKVVLRSRWGGWRQLFSTVLPSHALRGEDFLTVWLHGIDNPKTGRPIGSGPFLVAERERGRSVTFMRNPRYWGANRAYLDRIELRFCFTNCAEPVVEQIELLRGGDVDLVSFLGPSAEQLRQFRQADGVRVLSTTGPLWEHLDIRVESGGHPALRKKGVRQALAYGIDRAAIARLYGGDDARPSESAVLFRGSRGHAPNWARYGHRPDEARRLLEREGCQRDIDGIYICAGERMSLRLATTAAVGGPRERTAELVQRNLAQIGISVTPVFTNLTTLVEQILKRGSFDLALFNWIFGVDRAADLASFYVCGGRQNYAGYCQRLVTRDLDQATRLLRRSRLVTVLNRADKQLARDVPVIPLVQRPIVAAFTPSVRGVTLETGAWNPFQGAENWWLER